MSEEPVYRFVKGEGWVAEQPSKATAKWIESASVSKADYDRVCFICHERLGSHFYGFDGYIVCYDRKTRFVCPE